MKSVINLFAFLGLCLIFSPANAQSESAWDIFSDLEMRAVKCANNDSDKANISAITKKVNLFGTWKGSLDGNDVTAVFSKDSNGTYKGKAAYDGSSYGPYTIKLCDDNGSFYATAFGYNATFEVQSKTKIKVYSPLDSSESIVLKKQ